MPDRTAAPTASPQDRAYFERIAIASRELTHGRPPRSLADAFDRVARMEAIRGPLHVSSAKGEGDLQSHLAFLAACRRVWQTANILRVEDIIIHKLIAHRYQDLADVEAILATKPALDESYIERWAAFWEVANHWSALRES